MGRKRAHSASGGFLQAIHAEPDEDAHRLVYADWIEENGDPDRADFIRVQCQLACAEEADPRRAALEAREAELLKANLVKWTDLAFVSWLGHSRATCRNPRKHGFCTTVAEGLQAHIEQGTHPTNDPRHHAAYERRLVAERRMASRYKMGRATAWFGLWDANKATFRRGFVEDVQVYPYVIDLFAEAFADLTVLRRLVIDDEDGDAFVSPTRLVDLLGRLPLLSLDCRQFAEEDVEVLVGSPNCARLVDLKLTIYGYGDLAAERIAASPHLTGLKSLALTHVSAFTDHAVRQLLDSPHLHALKRLELVGEGLDFPMEISEPLRRECTARFGTEW